MKAERIPFNIPAVAGNEQKYLQQVIEKRIFAGDGEFTERCRQWLQRNIGCNLVLLTTSATHALEMAAILADVREGDEVIMPSFTFTSTANAFLLRGARIVFVDIRPDTMNIDEKKIEAAVTDRTRVIVPVHYGGVGCEMDEIMAIAGRYDLRVVEDAAQGLSAAYRGKKLGTIGHMGCFSFHESKNINCGEGGALLLDDESLFERAEIIREKGTNRSQFFQGKVDKYTWIDIGSSFLPSELSAAFLLAQLEDAEKITQDRQRNWKLYYDGLDRLELKEQIKRPVVPPYCQHNGHLFYIKTENKRVRKQLIDFLEDRNIMSVFHYIPLHTSKMGREFARFSADDRYTTSESERLLRLPLFYGMGEERVARVVEGIEAFFSE